MMISQEMKAINDLVLEFQQLKNRVDYLEKLVPNYGKAVAYNTTAKQQYQSPWSESYGGPNGYSNDPNRPFP